MSNHYRVFSLEFRMQLVKRILAGESVSKLQQELEIKRSMHIDGWISIARKVPPVWAHGRATPGSTHPTEPKPEGIWTGKWQLLQRKVGEQGAAAGFFRKSLQASKGGKPEQHQNWRDSIYRESGN